MIAPGQIWEVVLPCTYYASGIIPNIGDKFIVDSIIPNTLNDSYGPSWWIIDSYGQK